MYAKHKILIWSQTQANRH